MLKKSKYILGITALCLPLIARAADVDADVVELYKLVGNWYNNLLLPLGSVIAGIVIIIGGIAYSTSGGEPSKIQKGKELIIGAITGEILLLCAYLIVRQVIA